MPNPATHAWTSCSRQSSTAADPQQADAINLISRDAGATLDPTATNGHWLFASTPREGRGGDQPTLGRPISPGGVINRRRQGRN